MLMKEYRICVPLTVEEVSSTAAGGQALTHPGFALPRQVEVVSVLPSGFPSRNKLGGRIGGRGVLLLQNKGIPQERR